MHTSLLVLFASFAVFVGTCAGKLIGRVIGGQVADIENHPYQVFGIQEIEYMFTGVIIGQKTVVTSAHIIEPGLAPEDYEIQYGLSHFGGTENLITAETIKVHEKYNTNTNDYDVALIILKSRIPFGPTAQFIKLAKEIPAPCTNAVVSGWGSIGDITYNLQSVTVEIVPTEICEILYRRTHTKITKRMLCAGVPGGGKDACKGDSGGPLVVNGKLVGIVSFGVDDGTTQYPGVYANVPVLRDWIIENSPIEVFTINSKE